MFRTGLATSSSVLSRVAGWAVAGFLAVSLSNAAVARESTAAVSSAAEASISLAQLPAQAQEAYQHILSGGPFAYAKDGIVFGNREKQLPRHPRGYYHEYTVKTPGAKDRGARRIVCGGQPPTKPEACFYTDDHYASFRRIAP